jgi:hypothetical protein
MLLTGCIGESGFRGDVVVKRNIKPEFQESVLIAPGTHRYYMALYCKGSSAKYKSKTYELGVIEHYINPLDLGTISLRPVPAASDTPN